MDGPILQARASLCQCQPLCLPRHSAPLPYRHLLQARQKWRQYNEGTLRIAVSDAPTRGSSR